jgi:hypothetical protein
MMIIEHPGIVPPDRRAAKADGFDLGNRYG